MKENNKTSVKLSEKSRNFLNNIRLNRIKLDLSETNSNENLELVCDYFKANSEEYNKMLKYKKGLFG